MSNQSFIQQLRFGGECWKDLLDGFGLKDSKNHFSSESIRFIYEYFESAYKRFGLGVTSRKELGDGSGNFAYGTELDVASIKDKSFLDILKLEMGDEWGFNMNSLQQITLHKKQD